MVEDVRTKVGARWDQLTKTTTTHRLRWWMSPTICSNINRRVSGHEEPGLSTGLTRILMERLEGRVLKHGVSVGGGNGLKEMALLDAGVVETIDVFELAQTRVEQGRTTAEKRGLSSRIRFREEDAFENVAPGSVELVHWNNALHHMFDVDAAVRWSRDALVDGGVFYMDDFVGPDRFQWSDRSLEIAGRARGMLPDRFFVDPRDPSKSFRRTVARINPDRLAEIDPSEAVQSSRILPAVRLQFPDAMIQETGGAIYNTALSDVLANFDEDRDEDVLLLRALLLLDETALSIRGVDSHYAVALAFKNSRLEAHARRAVREAKAAAKRSKRAIRIVRGAKRFARKWAGRKT